MTTFTDKEMSMLRYGLGVDDDDAAFEDGLANALALAVKDGEWTNKEVREFSEKVLPALKADLDASPGDREAWDRGE